MDGLFRRLVFLHRLDEFVSLRTGKRQHAPVRFLELLAIHSITAAGPRHRTDFFSHFNCLFTVPNIYNKWEERWSQKGILHENENRWTVGRCRDLFMVLKAPSIMQLDALIFDEKTRG